MTEFFKPDKYILGFEAVSFCLAPVRTLLEPKKIPCFVVRNRVYFSARPGGGSCAWKPESSAPARICRARRSKICRQLDPTDDGTDRAGYQARKSSSQIEMRSTILRVTRRRRS